MEGPFPGFDPGLRKIATLPEGYRPAETRAMQINESGGLMMNPDGNVWWVPNKTAQGEDNGI